MASSQPSAEAGSSEASETRRLFGRHKGKRLRAAQQDLLQDLLPRLRIAPMNAPLDPLSLFARPVESVWLEIGFGGGEHLAWQAAANRTIGLIGCEFFEAGVVKLLRAVEAGALDNVRIHDRDARDLMDALPAQSIGRAFLLFPDPWPKARHHKRRFIQPETLASLARILKPGAQFRVATDIPDYVRWTLVRMRGAPAFEWLDEGPSDWARRSADWPPTRYEAKALREGRTPVYLTFRRRADL